MITSDFRIFNQFNEYIFVTTPKGEIIFENIVAIDFFGKINNFSKIKHYFSVSKTACLLTYRINTSIIDLMYESKQNFSAYCVYQKTNEDFYDLSINSTRLGDYVIIKFKDETKELKFEDQQSELIELRKNYKKLALSSEKLEKLTEKAQQYAIQTALINRLFAKIRKTDDITDLIKLVLEEIHELLGAYKTYYAEQNSKGLSIKLVNSTQYESEIGTKIQVDESVLQNLKDLKIHTSVCLKESLTTDKTLRKGTQRVVIPISDGKKAIGAIIALTVQASVVKANIELLETISGQLTGAVIRTLLTENTKLQNQKLRLAIKELKETQVQLINSEKLASLGQLIAGVAHEINTPLGSINSNNKMVKRIIETDSVVQNLEILKELNEIDTEAVKRISNIVKSLKKFVRLDEAEQQPADINSEIDLTLQLINHEIKNKVTVIKNYSELPMINCFANSLNQVFMNLLVNSCHSIKEKGEIIITTNIDSKMLTVSIKDNGSGIPKKIQNKIFDVGFTTKGIGVGTGLGLAISKKIIDMHKGSISFSSNEGEGTEFIVQIPYK